MIEIVATSTQRVNTSGDEYVGKILFGESGVHGEGVNQV